MLSRSCAALAALSIASALVGCASLTPDSAQEAVPIQAIASVPTSNAIPPVGTEAAPSLGETLTLDTLQEIALRENPTFGEFTANLFAARAEVLQAVLYPNPEAEGTFGIARSREIMGESEIEYGLSLTQPIELPSKRRTRRAAAEAAIPIVESEQAAFRVSLRAEVAKAFWTISYYERAIQLAEENQRISQEIELVVKRRVEGGESAEIDQIKAKVEALKAGRAVQSQRRRLASARAALDALCGGELPADFRIEGDLAGETTELELSTAIETSANHPKLLQVSSQIARQNAVIAREKAAWHPDLKPRVFGDREADADTFGVTLGIELPIFNRNQGGIAGAKAELQRLEAVLAGAQIEVRRQIEEAWQAHESAREQIAAYGAGLREGAAEALKIDTFLYEQGETDFLQLLDARRTAQETEAEYLQAIFDARISRAELDQAIGIGGIQP